MPVFTVGGDVWQQLLSLFDGHDTLIGRENDSDIECRLCSTDTVEVMIESEEHPFGALDVKTEITSCAVSEFFREVETAVSTIRVWKEMKDINSCDITQCREHLVECLSAFTFSKEHVDTSGRSVDRLPEELSVIADSCDEIVHYVINTTVITGHKCMFSHDSSWF